MPNETRRRTGRARAAWALLVPRRGGAIEPEPLRFRWSTRPAVLRRILRTAATSVVLACAARSARAAFDAPAISAQSAGMGGASLAGEGGDAASLFLNPAAGSGLAAPEAYFMYNRLFTGLSGVGAIGQGFLSFAAPTRYGTVGVGLSDFQAAGLLEERVLGVTFARRWFDSVDVGVTGKYLYQKYSFGSDPLAASDPVFARGGSRGAFAADLGVIVPITDFLSAGLAARNINSPNVGLATSDPVPRQFQGGLRYDFPEYALRLTADYAYSAAAAETFSQRSTPSLGLEKGFEHDRLKFRVGLTPDQFSGGVGVQFGPLGFDYAFLLNRTVLANNAGTQMVGIRYRFGDAPSGYRER